MITPARAWEATNQDPHEIWPVLLFNDVPVPFSDIVKIGNGYTAGDLVIVVTNISGNYNTTAANWKLILARLVPGLSEFDLGGIPLAQTTEAKRLLGYTDPTTNVTSNDGGPGSGSFTVAENIGKIEVPNGRGAAGTRELLNNPGEEVENLVYGSLWTSGSVNKKSYQSSSKRLVIAQVELGSSARLTGNAAAEQKKFFAKATLHIGCRVTGFENLSGISADSTDFVKKQVNVEWDALYEKVFRTTA